LTGERALSRCDYESAIGQLYFAPGEASKTITIPVIDDSYADGVERFQMELRIIVGASFGSPTQATLTINDNDVAHGQNQIESGKLLRPPTLY
jgi:hypothetical protein